MSVFGSSLFGEATFDEVVVPDGVGPQAPIPPPVRGVPLNAYKQFKFIDRNGNTYYKKREQFNGY